MRVREISAQVAELQERTTAQEAQIASLSARVQQLAAEVRCRGSLHGLCSFSIERRARRISLNRVLAVFL